MKMLADDDEAVFNRFVSLDIVNLDSAGPEDIDVLRTGQIVRPRSDVDNPAVVACRGKTDGRQRTDDPVLCVCQSLKINSTRGGQLPGFRLIDHFLLTTQSKPGNRFRHTFGNTQARIAAGS